MMRNTWFDNSRDVVVDGEHMVQESREVVVDGEYIVQEKWLKMENMWFKIAQL